MVFLTDLSGPEGKIVYGIFGVQHRVLTQEKRNTISTLYSLLSQSAGRVDHLQDESHGLPRSGPKATTFIAYWLHPEEYSKLLGSTPWKKFWGSLSEEDAGAWREVMTVPKSRFMHASSQNVKSGIATLMELVTSNDEGYWGVYRHRLSAVRDRWTDPTDTFTSPFVTAAAESKVQDKPVIDIPNRNLHNPTVTPGTRRGNIAVTKIPENLVFVREAQRQPNCPQEETEAWLESIAPHAKSWIEHLDGERNKNGVMAFTTHIGHETPSEPKASSSVDSGLGLDVAADLELDTEKIPEANQLAYFLDLKHFEGAGRSHKGHVQLRKNVMTIYGPGGRMSAMGKAVLYVELCVLKKGDLDAEYIGCAEGTGLMYLENL